MRAKERLRIGLVGCGEVAQWAHIPALKRIRNAELAVVCDKDEEAAIRVARRFYVGKHYADFLQMLEKEPLDMIEICTPPDTHAAISIRAMEAGCHVLVAKPMAIGTKEADKMIETARNCGVNLGVVHNMLFVPVGVKARNMVSEGGIGNLTGVDIKYSLYQYDREIVDWNHWCRTLPGDVFGNKLPHPIYLAMAFLGKLEPVSAHAVRLSNHDWMPFDEVRVILEGERGLGTITSSTNWPKDMAMIDIFGTETNLRVYFNNAVVIKYGHDRYGRFSRGLENVRQSFQMLADTASTAVNIAAGRHHYGHLALIHQFVESVLNRTEPPVTAEEGREVTRLCEQIIHQLDGGTQHISGS